MRQKLDTVRQDPRLGKVSDPELAQLLGVSKRTICDARLELGIPPYIDSKYERAEAGIIEALKQGPVIDKELARRYGVSNHFVARVRKDQENGKWRGELLQNWGRV